MTLIVTNKSIRVWKFNPNHDRSSGQFSSGGIGSGSGSGIPNQSSRLNSFHNAVLPVSLPAGIQKTNAFKLAGKVLGRYTQWKGPQGTVSVTSLLRTDGSITGRVNVVESGIIGRSRSNLYPSSDVTRSEVAHGLRQIAGEVPFP